MAATRPLMVLLGLIFLAGGMLLQFLTVLSGGVKSFPENLIYFLEAGTNGIAGAPNPVRWTYFALCGVDGNGHNANCGKATAALPFNPSQNFHTSTPIKGQFYTSRAMFAFYLIALFFAAIALLTGLLAICTRLGSYLSSLMTFIAMVMQAVTAALMTAWTIKGRNSFRSAGMSAKLGVKAYAFTWTALACFLISSILFCLGGAANKDRSNRRGMFGRSRSTRSRGSFIDNESQRRVKDEYE